VVAFVALQIQIASNYTYSIKLQLIRGRGYLKQFEKNIEFLKKFPES